MDFEYDPEKCASNKDKHGIDFEEAQELWLDDSRFVIPTDRVEEQRFLAIGKIGEKVWTAVFVKRADRVRLISVRRSRSEEARQYEKNLGS